MANKRESSSQRRQRENRARRAALEARTKGAPPARPSRVAPSTAEKLKARSAEAGSSKAGAATGPSDDAGKTTKNGKPHSIPLPAMAIELLDSLTPNEHGFFFPGSKDPSKSVQHTTLYSFL